MNAAMGCLVSEKWWADQRVKRRTVVLVIVLIFYGWLTASTQMTPVEAVGVVLMVGLAAGVVLDRVVDGARLASAAAVLHQLVDGATGRP